MTSKPYTLPPIKPSDTLGNMLNALAAWHEASNNLEDIRAVATEKELDAAKRKEQQAYDKLAALIDNLIEENTPTGAPTGAPQGDPQGAPEIAPEN